MQKNKTLLIMAAGMGSRFGGLKQIEPMGPNREFLIDYSIYDAKKAGFTKVVFIIKEENYELFKETVGKRVEPYIKTEYVFQTIDNIKAPYHDLVKNRLKPLGTAHAILCAKDKIHEPFAIINADDFYGRDAYIRASEYLDTIDDNHYAVVAYLLGNTLTPNGAAKRGVCQVNSKNELTSIVESSVILKGDMVEVSPLDGSIPFTTSKDTIASMNMFLFTTDLFTILETKLASFLEENKADLSTCEFLIPNVLNDCLTEKRKTIDVIKTNATWYGVTYKDDKEKVCNALKNLTEEGIYQSPLWKDNN